MSLWKNTNENKSSLHFLQARCIEIEPCIHEGREVAHILANVLEPEPSLWSQVLYSLHAKLDQAVGTMWCTICWLRLEGRDYGVV
jgi:hypothetical protein